MNKELQKEISDWDSWNAREYLETYYGSPIGDTFATLDFITDELKDYKHKPFKNALEFGTGPTLFGALATIPFVQKLHLSDYLPQNLNEIKHWLANGNDSFNWDVCTAYLLEKDGIEPTADNIAKWSNELRAKVGKILPGDITKEWPLLDEKSQYDLLVSLFCADSITNSKTEWHQYMKNLFNLAAPQGTIIIGALRNCPFYRVGEQYFPCANVNEKDLEDAISGMSEKIKDYTIRVNNTEDCEDEGFTSVMFARITLK